jgi:hypothetical protein
LCDLFLFLTILYFINSTEECGRSFVFRRNETRYASNRTKKIKRCGRKLVPVLAWHIFDGAGKIHRIDGRLTSKQYIRILEDVLLPSSWERFGTDELIPFVQDQSTIHRIHMIMDWFDEEDVSFELKPWPQREPT